MEDYIILSKAELESKNIGQGCYRIDKTVNGLWSLTGRRFKRNKYGLSNWEDVVLGVGLSRRYIAETGGYKPIITVKGSRGIDFDLDEVVFMDEKGSKAYQHIIDLKENKGKITKKIIE